MIVEPMPDPFWFALRRRRVQAALLSLVISVLLAAASVTLGADAITRGHVVASLKTRDDPAAKALRQQSIALWRDARTWRKDGGRRERPEPAPIVPNGASISFSQLRGEVHPARAAAGRCANLDRRTWHPRDPPRLAVPA